MRTRAEYPYPPQERSQVCWQDLWTGDTVLDSSSALSALPMPLHTLPPHQRAKKGSSGLCGFWGTMYLGRAEGNIRIPGVKTGCQMITSNAGKVRERERQSARETRQKRSSVFVRVGRERCGRQAGRQTRQFGSRVGGGGLSFVCARCDGGMCGSVVLQLHLRNWSRKRKTEVPAATGHRSVASEALEKKDNERGGGI